MFTSIIPYFYTSELSSTNSTFISLVNNALNKIYEAIEKHNYSFVDDIDLVDGILNINVNDGKKYVINIQKNNKQIWYSSPFSGPKRFEYKNNKWINIMNKNEELYTILNNEFNNIYKLKGNDKLKLI